MHASPQLQNLHRSVHIFLGQSAPPISSTSPGHQLNQPHTHWVTSMCSCLWVTHKYFQIKDHPGDYCLYFCPMCTGLTHDLPHLLPPQPGHQLEGSGGHTPLTTTPQMRQGDSSMRETEVLKSRGLFWGVNNCRIVSGYLQQRPRSRLIWYRQVRCSGPASRCTNRALCLIRF